MIYLGDVTQEAQVLEWALYQAGIKTAVKEEDSSIESVVEEVIEEIDDMLTFPGASAEEEPVPETMKPKVAPKVNKSQPQVEEEATPEPLSEIVDIIKNDNNVVVFFCKYKLVLDLFAFFKVKLIHSKQSYPFYPQFQIGMVKNKNEAVINKIYLKHQSINQVKETCLLQMKRVTMLYLVGHWCVLVPRKLFTRVSILTS